MGTKSACNKLLLPQKRCGIPSKKNVPGIGIGRDGCRTPMQWNSSEFAGFSAVEPWLPLANNFREENVATSRDDKYSLFRLYRRLINLRRSHIALTVLFFREWRDDRLLIALNMGCQPSAISFAGQRLSGFVLLSTFADREGEAVADTVDLRGNEGLVVTISPSNFRN